MPKRLYKILILLGIVAVLVIIPLFYFALSSPKNLEIDFLDIGQGDAILVKSPYGQNILIDGGPDNTIIKRLAENLSWWDKTIDLMILTHPHDDHVGGLNDVLKRYRVEKILYTGVVHDSPAYLNWLELIKNKNTPLVIIDRPQKIVLGEECYLDIIYPFESLSGKEVENLNNSSIVTKLLCGGGSFLFTGDIEVEVEQELLSAGVDLGVDILKVGHHGSDTSSSEEFLETVNPDISVIQVGADNQFGHPSLRTIRRLERIDSEIYRNDLEGTIKVTIENGKIIVLD